MVYSSTGRYLWARPALPAESVARGADGLFGIGATSAQSDHRDDISSAIWACLAAPSTIGNEIFNCSDDHASKKQDVLSWLAQQLDVDPPVWGNEGESLGGRLVRNRVISHEKLTRLLGWRPTYPTFHEGYKQILR